MRIGYQANYVRSLIKRYGVRGLWQKTLERAQSPMRDYKERYLEFLPTEEELARQREEVLEYTPCISIALPTYETKEEFLCNLIDALQSQSYGNWELCIADGSRSDCVKEVLKSKYAGEERIRYQKLENNGGISVNTNAAFEMTRGEYVALMDHDDVLTFNALYEIVHCLGTYTQEEREYALVYSDEDKMNADRSEYSRPHFKPDYNPEFLKRNNYFCHFLVVSRQLLQKTGGLREEFDGAQDYDFVLRCVRNGAIVRHIPKILYHWRIHEGSTAGNSEDKAYAFEKGCRAIEEYLQSIGEPAKVSVTPNLGVYQVDYELLSKPRVTMVVSDVRQVEALKRQTYQEHFDYIFAEEITNQLIEYCDNEYICFMGQDAYFHSEDAVEKMLKICQHSSVGVVGAKLIDSNGKIVEAGLVHNEEAEFVGSCSGLPKEFKGYFLHAVIPKNVSAVSFEVVMIKKSAWSRVDGLEDGLEGVYRAADYCFQLRQIGYEVVVAADVAADVRKDFDIFCKERDRMLLKEKWQEEFEMGDSCYNANLKVMKNHTYEMK